MNIKEAEAHQLAIHRSLAYGLFSQLLEYPDEGLLEKLVDGELADQLHQSVCTFEPGEDESAFWHVDYSSVKLQDLRDEYSLLFDVGVMGSPPCPLMGSAYTEREKMKVMEEALRFYNYFGLILNQQQKAMPDQLGTELEFLCFLTHSQAELLENQQSAESHRRAERDFLNRELLFWVQKMNEKMKKVKEAHFYKPLTLMLEAFMLSVVKHPCMALAAE